MNVHEVHIKLLTTLPVRTVLSRRPPVDPAVRYSDRKPGEMKGRIEEQVRLIRRAQEMAAFDVPRTVIAEELNLSTSTVDKYVSPNCISTAAKAALNRRL